MTPVGRPELRTDISPAPHRRWGGRGHLGARIAVLETALDACETVSESLAEWESFESSAPDLLARLGTAMGARLALLWLRERRGGLAIRVSWSESDTQTRTGIARGAQRRAVLQARPLVSAACTSGLPAIAGSAAAASGERTDGRIDSGGALAIPATHQGQTLAVLSLHFDEDLIDDDRLARALRAIGLGVGRQLARQRRELGDRRLSARELEVLQLAADGLMGPAIATRLFVSPATVKTHFLHIYEKLGAADRASAVAVAMREGLIS